MERQIVKRSAFFFIFSVLTVLLFYGPLKELFGLSLHEELYSHIILVPLVSGYLLYAKRKVIFADHQCSFITGIPVLTVGIILSVIGQGHAAHLNQNNYLSLMTFAAVTCWIGGFVIFYGVQAFRAAVFPLLFLVFMVPVPSPVLETVIPLLQRGSAAAAHGLFKLTGVPVFLEGFTFHLPGLDVEVAEQCSGIRSSLALFITSILAGHFFLQSSWKKIVLTLCVFPITIFKNGLRILTLSLLAAYVDPRILSGTLHTRGGFPSSLWPLLCWRLWFGF